MNRLHFFISRCLPTLVTCFSLLHLFKPERRRCIACCRMLWWLQMVVSRLHEVVLSNGPQSDKPLKVWYWNGWNPCVSCSVVHWLPNLLLRHLGPCQNMATRSVSGETWWDCACKWESTMSSQLPLAHMSPNTPLLNPLKPLQCSFSSRLIAKLSPV